MNKLRTAKKIFEEELSGEPLEQTVVIEAIQIAQKEIISEICDMSFDDYIRMYNERYGKLPDDVAPFFNIMADIKEKIYKDLNI